MAIDPEELERRRQAREQQRLRREQEQKLLRRRLIIAAAILVVALIVILICVFAGDDKEEIPEEETAPAQTVAVLKPTDPDDEETVIRFAAAGDLNITDKVVASCGPDFDYMPLIGDVMPLLAAENPQIAENLSRMALRLRLDEEFLSQQVDSAALGGVESLRTMPKALRNRALEAFLKENGVREPEDAHIALTEALVFSEKPSARASRPGGITIAREYDALVCLAQTEDLEETVLPCPGEVCLAGLRVICEPASETVSTPDAFTVCPVGQIRLRSRRSGDSIRLGGGTKSLKKLFIDRKIPAARRNQIPVVCDDAGVLGVYTIGANWDRTSGESSVTIRFENTENKGE